MGHADARVTTCAFPGARRGRRETESLVVSSRSGGTGPGGGRGAALRLQRAPTARSAPPAGSAAGVGGDRCCLFGSTFPCSSDTTSPLNLSVSLNWIVVFPIK